MATASQMPARLDVQAWHTDDWSLTIIFPESIAGWEAVARIETAPQTEIATSIGGADDKELSLSVPRAQLVQIPPGEYPWDLWLNPGSNGARTYIYGTWLLYSRKRQP